MTTKSTKTRKKTMTMEEMQEQMKAMQEELAKERQARQEVEEKLKNKSAGRTSNFAGSVTSYQTKLDELLQDKGIMENRQLYAVLQIASEPNQDLESLAKRLGQKKSSPATAKSWGKQWVAVLLKLGCLDMEQSRKLGIIE